MTLKDFLEEWNGSSDMVRVHTSGSTGEPKPMLVSKARMLSSARATCDFLGLKSGDRALLCLPLDYIAGKMMVVRAIERGMKLTDVCPDGHPLASLASRDACSAPAIDLAAMVPMQVYNSLEIGAEAEQLKHIRHLLIGGGAIDDALENRIRHFFDDETHLSKTNVWSTYGMTETLSHVALRRVNGSEASLWYTPLPGVSISLGNDDTLVINYPSVCDMSLTTHDVAVLRTKEDPLTGKTLTQFRILGRTDNIICSGGLKIQAEEIERLLRNELPVPYIITSCKDEKLGEKIVLLAERMDESDCENICRRVLPRHYVPRKYVFVDSIPMTPNGKVARAEARQISGSTPV